MQDEKENLLYRFNQTSYFPYTPQHIMDIFHDKVARFPERVALMEGKEHQTYAQVNAKANQLARQIVASKKAITQQLACRCHVPRIWSLPYWLY